MVWKIGMPGGNWTPNKRDWNPLLCLIELPVHLIGGERGIRTHEAYFYALCVSNAVLLTTQPAHLNLDRGDGFEPSLPESKSSVLPLDYPRIIVKLGREGWIDKIHPCIFPFGHICLILFHTKLSNRHLQIYETCAFPVKLHHVNWSTR